MIIEINTESLVNLRITPDEYLYLYLLHHKAYDILDTLNLNVAYEDLQTKGYIKLGQDVQSHVVRSAFTETFSTPFLQMWHGLLSHFPLKVNSKTGVRVLRAKDAMAKANEKARLRYQKYVGGNIHKHNEVIKALQTELDIRRKGDQLEYMQQLTTWVNNHTWEKYIGLDESNTESRSIRITRQL